MQVSNPAWSLKTRQRNAAGDVHNSCGFDSVVIFMYAIICSCCTEQRFCFQHSSIKFQRLYMRHTLAGSIYRLWHMGFRHVSEGGWTSYWTHMPYTYWCKCPVQHFRCVRHQNQSDATRLKQPTQLLWVARDMHLYKISDLSEKRGCPGPAAASTAGRTFWRVDW